MEDLGYEGALGRMLEKPLGFVLTDLHRVSGVRGFQAWLKYWKRAHRSALSQVADDAWLDDAEADSDLEEMSNNRKTFDVSDAVNISFHKFRDLLSPSLVLPPVQEVSEVEAILPRKEPPTPKFVFSLK